MIATSKKIRFTVDEYFRMSEAGVLDGKRVELIEGRIVRMHAQAHPHRWMVTRISRLFLNPFDRNKFWVVVQGTLTLGRFNAPDPDVHVFDVPEGTEEAQLPKPFIVVEISDTTYRKDSGIKLRQYAAAGIQDYWIVNLKSQQIEVYRTPENPTGKSKGWRYADVKSFRKGSEIKFLAYPKIKIAVDEIVPRTKSWGTHAVASQAYLSRSADRWPDRLDDCRVREELRALLSESNLDDRDVPIAERVSNWQRR